jgi:hypothetical protein
MDLSLLPRRCSASLKIRGIYGTSTGHPIIYHCFSLSQIGMYYLLEADSPWLDLPFNYWTATTMTILPKFHLLRQGNQSGIQRINIINCQPFRLSSPALGEGAVP